MTQGRSAIPIWSHCRYHAVMLSASMALRALAVAAFGAAPIAALETAPLGAPTPNIATGDALAEGPGTGIDNTGGNIELGVIERSNGPVVGPAPEAGGGKTLAAPVPVTPVNPGADAVARAHKLVADARARAQAMVDAAKAQADAAVEQAHQNAAEAQARSQAQSDAARARSSSASTQAHG